MQKPPAAPDASSAPLIRDALSGRTAHQFRSTRIPSSLPSSVDLTGFAELGMSGSSQFSEFGWREIRKHLDGVSDSDIFVLDFREESHGFLNGSAVSWYAEHNWGNVGLSPDQIVALEELRLSVLRKSEQVEILVGHEVRDRKNPTGGAPSGPPRIAPPVSGTSVAGAPVGFYCAAGIAEASCPSQNGRISKTAKIARNEVEHWPAERVSSERELVALPDGNYVRFPVTDHLRPTDSMLEAFVAFVRRLPERPHLHFHCHGGDGRTTSFMTMYDMLRNAKRVAFDDLIARNRSFSTYCLCKIQTDFHRPYAVERWDLLKRFYEYAKSEGAIGRRYTAWASSRP